jgi:hypothetical protein
MLNVRIKMMNFPWNFLRFEIKLFGLTLNCLKNDFEIHSKVLSLVVLESWRTVCKPVRTFPTFPNVSKL